MAERPQTPRYRVLERYPEANLAWFSTAKQVDPLRRHEDWYFAVMPEAIHRPGLAALGTGATPEAAWEDALQRIQDTSTLRVDPGQPVVHPTAQLGHPAISLRS